LVIDHAATALRIPRRLRYTRFLPYPDVGYPLPVGSTVTVTGGILRRFALGSRTVGSHTRRLQFPRLPGCFLRLLPLHTLVYLHAFGSHDSRFPVVISRSPRHTRLPAHRRLILIPLRCRLVGLRSYSYSYCTLLRCTLYRLRYSLRVDFGSGLVVGHTLVAAVLHRGHSAVHLPHGSRVVLPTVGLVKTTRLVKHILGYRFGPLRLQVNFSRAAPTARTRSSVGPTLQLFTQLDSSLDVTPQLYRLVHHTTRFTHTFYTPTFTTVALSTSSLDTGWLRLPLFTTPVTRLPVVAGLRLRLPHYIYTAVTRFRCRFGWFTPFTRL